MTQLLSKNLVPQKINNTNTFDIYAVYELVKENLDLFEHWSYNTNSIFMEMLRSNLLSLEDLISHKNTHIENIESLHYEINKLISLYEFISNSNFRYLSYAEQYLDKSFLLSKKFDTVVKLIKWELVPHTIASFLLEKESLQPELSLNEVFDLIKDYLKERHGFILRRDSGRKNQIRKWLIDLESKTTEEKSKKYRTLEIISILSDAKKNDTINSWAFIKKDSKTEIKANNERIKKLNDLLINLNSKYNQISTLIQEIEIHLLKELNKKSQYYYLSKLADNMQINELIDNSKEIKMREKRRFADYNSHKLIFEDTYKRSIEHDYSDWEQIENERINSLDKEIKHIANSNEEIQEVMDKYECTKTEALEILLNQNLF